jgi:hypothetical protein
VADQHRLLRSIAARLDRPLHGNRDLHGGRAVKAFLTLAGITALVPASAPAAEGEGGARPRIALSVSPAQVALTVPGSRTIRVRNEGAERVVVDVTRRTWLRSVPARLSLRSGESAILTLGLRRPPHAEPGDHRALVLLTTRPLRAARVNVQVRLGVRVRLRVPGRILWQLTLGRLRVERERGARLMFISVANHGNVTVPLRGHVTASLLRGGGNLRASGLGHDARCSQDHTRF